MKPVLEETEKIQLPEVKEEVLINKQQLEKLLKLHEEEFIEYLDPVGKVK